MTIIEQLKNQIGFTHNEKLINQYILGDIEAVLHMSIQELAIKTNSSASTIVRLCKKCHLDGFREFKIALARDYEDYSRRQMEINANIPFEARDTDLLISTKIAQLTSETVLTTQKLLTTKKLNHCVDLMLGAKNIVGIGVSDCFIKLQDFQLKLLRINRYVQLINLQAEQFFLANQTGDKDVAILVSYSGKTAEIINDAQLFYRNQTPIIAITSDVSSPLAKYATEMLLLPNKEQRDVKMSNFSSQIAIEYLLNVLYSCIFNRNFESNYEKRKATPVSSFEF